MSENHQTNNVLDPVFQPMLEFWSEYIEKNKEQTNALVETMRETCDLKALQRRWLDSLGQSLDLYMRTPTFLEAMRRNFEAVTEFRTKAEEVAQEVARETGIPRITDISGLFERLRVGQEAILARLDAIERRLDALQKPGKRSGH